MRCQYFAIAYMLIVNNGTADNDFLFPTYGPIAAKENEQGKVDSKVSDAWNSQFKVLIELRDNYLDDEDYDDEADLGLLNDKLTSHHGKKAANVDLSDSPAAGLGQIYRTGWIVKSIHSLFKYIYGTTKMDTKSAKALAGWQFEIANGWIYGGYPPEKADIVTEPEKFPAFAQRLFENVSGMEKPLLELLAMTVLMRLDSVIVTINEEPNRKWESAQDHPFVHFVMEAAAAAGVSEQGFQNWKKEANEGFETRNRPALSVNYSPSMQSAMLDPRCFLGVFNSLVTLTQSLNGAYCFDSCVALCNVSL